MQTTRTLERGCTVFYKPSGDKFLMPPGGDESVYLRKGFTYLPPPKPLADGAWKGRRCVIVGGGPSLRDYDWGRLEGHLTIGINQAVEFFDPTVSFFTDSRWYEWITTGELGEHARRRYAEYQGIKATLNLTGATYPADIVQFKEYVNPRGLSHSLQFGIGHSGDSGIAALNMALCLGASEIYLLGFDMNTDGRANIEHFHAGYPEQVRGKKQKHVIAAFNAIAGEALSRAKIYNCNPESGIKCFPVAPMPRIRKGNFTLQSLKEGAWAGRRCFLIGGGPSLKGFDFSQLQGELTVGINRAYEVMNPSVIFSIDTRFYDWIIDGEYGQESLEKFRAYRGPKLWMDGRGDHVFDSDVEVIPGAMPAGVSWDLSQGLHFGENSGFAALNFAVAMGCTEIYLLGFDMHSSNGQHQAWWHDGHPLINEGSVYAKYIKYFVDVAKELQDAGVRVVNLNRDSSLPCFPFGDLEPVLADKPERPTVISYYTKNTGYEQEIKRMMRTAIGMGLSVDVEGIDSLGGWQANTHYKPDFIRRKMQEYEGPVLWLDADLEIKRYPDLFDDMDADFATCQTDWSKYESMPGRNDVEMNSSVLFIRNTKNTRAFMDAWVATCQEAIAKSNTGPWEQKHMQNVFEKFCKKLRFRPLPDSYCQIFDLMAEAGDPVIEIYQASRRLKREVGQ